MNEKYYDKYIGISKRMSLCGIVMHECDKMLYEDGLIEGMQKEIDEMKCIIGKLLDYMIENGADFDVLNTALFAGKYAEIKQESEAKDYAHAAGTKIHPIHQDLIDDMKEVADEAKR